MKELKLKSTVKDVPLSKMKVSPRAQRELNKARVDHLVSEFDPELLGYPVMSYRDGFYFTVDGQHRIEALKAWLGDWEKQSITCRVYTGLTEPEEANLFDKLDDALAVSSFQKFKVRVTAGRPDEVAVAKIVHKAGLKVSLDKAEGCIFAVGTLLKIFKRSDAEILRRTLIITFHSFGQPGLRTAVLDGVARVCDRYNGEFTDEAAIERLSNLRGGVGALTAKSHLLQKQTGIGIGECFAAAMVDALNANRTSGKKLPSWWKS